MPFSLHYLKLVFLLIGLSTLQPLAAQTKLADHTYGGFGHEASVGGVSTSDGGFLLGSSTNSEVSGEVTQPHRGPAVRSNGDYWIVKTDAQGNKLWDKRYGGPENDQLINIVSAADGGFLLCGWSASTAGFDKTEASRGLVDYWVVKIDAQGAKQWDKRFGGSGDDFLASAVALPDGGHLLIGSSTRRLTTPEITPNGDRSEPVLGDSDIWMVKIDAQGTKVWDKRIGGPEYDYAFDAALVSDGSVVVGAWIALSGLQTVMPGGDISGTGKGEADFWIFKIDTQGNKVWDKLYGGAGQDYIRALIATPDGGVLAAGLSSSPLSADKSVATIDKECWVIKLDRQGDKQWDEVFGTRLLEYPTVLQLNPKGGYFLGGHSGRITAASDSDDIPYDAWIVDMDEQGQQRWEKSFGGASEERLTSILPRANGNMLLVGQSLSNISRDKTANSRGESDIWTMEVGGTVLSDKNPVVLPEVVSLFPNPATQPFVTLEATGLRNQNSIRVDLLNGLGQTIQTHYVPVHGGQIHHQFNVGHLSAGLYIVRLFTGTGTITKRLVK